MNKINRFLLIVILILSLVSTAVYHWGMNMYRERNRYRYNTDALLSEVKKLQIDSSTMAVDVRMLNLTLDEFKQYRAQDAEELKKMNIRLKSLQSAAKHKIEVNVPIKTEVKDSVIIRDSTIIEIKKIDMKTPHLHLCGVIENNQLIGKIHLPVTLHQAVWVEHKRRFLWWRWGVKAIHQTISSDNPYVEIKYSEIIQIKK